MLNLKRMYIRYIGFDDHYSLSQRQNFIDMFNYLEDLAEVIIDFKNSHVRDNSVVTTIMKVKQKYSPWQVRFFCGLE